MKPTNVSIWALPILAAGSIALSGCGRGNSTPTTISYRQIGICKTFDTPNGTEKAKTDEAFAIFKIEKIDNTKYNSLFNFDPDRLYIDQSNAAQRARSVYDWNRRFVSPDIRYTKALDIKNVKLATIPAGETLDTDSYVFIPIGTNNPTEGPEDKQFNLELVYDTGTNDRGNIQSVSEGMLLVKTNPPDTKYTVTESCKELTFK